MKYGQINEKELRQAFYMAKSPKFYHRIIFPFLETWSFRNHKLKQEIICKFFNKKMYILSHIKGD